jgi:hypothetical protein
VAGLATSAADWYVEEKATRNPISATLVPFFFGPKFGLCSCIQLSWQFFQQSISPLLFPQELLHLENRTSCALPPSGMTFFSSSPLTISLTQLPSNRHRENRLWILFWIFSALYFTRSQAYPEVLKPSFAMLLSSAQMIFKWRLELVPYALLFETSHGDLELVMFLRVLSFSSQLLPSMLIYKVQSCTL